MSLTRCYDTSRFNNENWYARCPFFLNLFLRDREPLTWIEEEHVNLALLACYNTNLLRIFQYGILVLLMWGHVFYKWWRGWWIIKGQIGTWMQATWGRLRLHWSSRAWYIQHGGEWSLMLCEENGIFYFFLQETEHVKEGACS